MPCWNPLCRISDVGWLGADSGRGQHWAMTSGLHSGLTREWRELAGYSPAQWRREELPFLQDHEPVG